MITQSDMLECELARRTSELTDIERWSRIVLGKEPIAAGTDISALLRRIEEMDGRIKDLPQADWSFVRSLIALYRLRVSQYFQALPVSGAWWRWLKTRDGAVVACWCLFALAVRAALHPLISPSLINLQPVLRYIHSE
jgi:hypothetical protein